MVFLVINGHVPYISYIDDNIDWYATLSNTKLILGFINHGIRLCTILCRNLYYIIKTKTLIQLMLTVCYAH